MSKDKKILIPIIVAIIGGLFGLVEIIIPYVLDAGGNSLVTEENSFEIVDVVVSDCVLSDCEGETCLDFRVSNKSSHEVIISRVHFEVIEVTHLNVCYDRLPSLCPYDLIIGYLQKEGDEADCVVCQVVSPDCVDRFVIKLQPPGCSTIWLLKISLITSEGTLVWEEPVEIKM